MVSASARFSRRKSRDPWLIALAVMAAIFGAHAASELLVPVTFSMLAALGLAPAVRALCTLRIPRALSSLLVVLAMLAALTTVAAALITPAQSWLQRLPQVASRLEQQMHTLGRPFHAASAALQRMADLAQGPAPASVPTVMVKPQGGLLAAALKAAPELVMSAVFSTFLILLLLVHGENLLRKSVTLPDDLATKKDVVVTIRAMQRELSRYLLAIGLINLGLGACTALAMQLLGVADPLLWGGLAALFNFAAYIGPAAMAVLLLGVGFSQFDGGLHAIGPAAIFLLFHGCESQFITPTLVGRRLALDPVAVLLSLLLFGWLWGVAGLLMAPPLLTCAKVAAERVWPHHALLRMMTA